MKKLALDELQRDIEIQLRVLRGPVKTALQRISGDRAAETAARLIIERCLSNCAIFEPDHVQRTPGENWRQGAHTPGRFGITEAWPQPPTEPEHSDRCRICSANDVAGLQEQLAIAMWTALMPNRRFEDAGEYRANFLLIAARAINWLGKAHSAD